MLPGSAVPGSCLVSFYFLWAILSTSTVEYFNFRSTIQLYHPVQRSHVPQLKWSGCETLLWPQCIGDCEEHGRWEILLPAQVPWTGPWQGHQVEAEWQSPYNDKLVSISTGCPKCSVSTLTDHISVISQWCEHVTPKQKKIMNLAGYKILKVSKLTH